MVGPRVLLCVLFQSRSTYESSRVEFRRNEGLKGLWQFIIFAVVCVCLAVAKNQAFFFFGL